MISSIALHKSAVYNTVKEAKEIPKWTQIHDVVIYTVKCYVFFSASFFFIVYLLFWNITIRMFEKCSKRVRISNFDLYSLNSRRVQDSNFNEDER